MIAIDLQLLGRIAALRRFEPRTLEIAERLFIHGETPKRVASEFGINLQRVYAIRKEILAAAATAALPAGWIEVTLAGPREVIEQLLRDMERAMGELQGSGAELRQGS